MSKRWRGPAEEGLRCAGPCYLERRDKPMRVTIAILAVLICVGAAQADDPYWLLPMQDVHADYTGSGGTISRFGDSISVSMAYFVPMQYGHTNTTPDDTTALSWIRSYVTTASWHWQDNNVYHLHGCDGGTTSYWPIQSAPPTWPGYQPGERRVDYWLRNDNPEMAVIMWGTNDCHAGTPAGVYKENLRQVVQACVANGTIPIITTIPPRRGYTPGVTDTYSNAVRALALEEQIPLIEYNGEVHTRRPAMTWDGTLISGDGVHPSNTAPARDFSETMLSTNGYTLRNWVTLHGAHEVWEQAIHVPPPPPPNVTLSHDIKYVGGTYGLTFTLDGGDGLEADLLLDMIFTGDGGGQIQQVQAFGMVDVDSDDMAITFDAMPTSNYDMDLDSYFFQPFTDNVTDPPGLIEGPNSYYIMADAGAAGHNDGFVAYIACRRGEVFPFSGTIVAPPPGDANRDGYVDGLDYVVWSNNYLYTAVGWDGADINGDGIADGLDYVMWSNFYNPQPGGVVPEPASALLLVLGAWALRRRRG